MDLVAYGRGSEACRAYCPSGGLLILVSSFSGWEGGRRAGQEEEVDAPLWITWHLEHRGHADLFLLVRLGILQVEVMLSQVPRHPSWLRHYPQAPTEYEVPGTSYSYSEVDT